MNAQEQERQDAAAARVPVLVARFDGAIKYLPMLLDRPKWTDDDCEAFARKLHALAVLRRKAGETGWDPENPERLWNHGIPYCRNVWKEPK